MVVVIAEIGKRVQLAGFARGHQEAIVHPGPQAGVQMVAVAGQRESGRIGSGDLDFTNYPDVIARISGIERLDIVWQNR